MSFAISSLGGFVSSVGVGRCRWCEADVKVRSRRPGLFMMAQKTRKNLYTVLGLDELEREKVTGKEVRAAYLKKAKTLHPDVVVDGDSQANGDFDEIAEAYQVLSDVVTRRVYDAMGWEGVEALRVLEQRNKQHGIMTEEEAEMVEHPSDGATLFLEVGDLEKVGDEWGQKEDAVPRSVEEAIWQVKNHQDSGYRYYAAWWLSRNRIAEAESTLVEVLQTDPNRTSRGGYSVRRRAAIALGTSAHPPIRGGEQRTLVALADALGADDYFLRYRAAEALARIIMRNGGPEDIPPVVASKTRELLKKGQEDLIRQKSSASNLSQESMFDLDQYDEETREKLRAIFAKRAAAEKRSRRTSMTPNLDVQLSEDDEPYEWLLKIVGELRDVSQRSVVETFLESPIPLVRYAANRAMYRLTQDPQYTSSIMEGLEFGAEHHYSQRVLIRDLGDVGYMPGAAAIASCGMVENSFKLLSLKNLVLNNVHEESLASELKFVFDQIDSLL